MNKVSIVLYNTYGQVLGLTAKDYSELRKICGWRDPDYYYANKSLLAKYEKKNKKYPIWDGYYTLINKRGVFPSGLYEHVTNYYYQKGTEIKLVDKRDKLKIDIDSVYKRLENLNIVLRPYQLEGLLLGFKNTNMLFEHPTASGKSILFSSLIQAYNLPTLIIVNRIELVNQLVDVLRNTTSLDIGQIGDSIWQPSYVTVACVNSLMTEVSKKRVKQINQFLSTIKYFIADESHHLGADGWYKVAMNCKKAVVRHGFSGTCFRSDSKDIKLLACTGPVKHKLTTSDLIKEGWLSKPNIYLVKLYKTIYHSNFWQEVEYDYLMKNEKRNNIAVSFAYHFYKQNKQILIIVRLVEHAKIIYDKLLKKGVNSDDIAYATGKDDSYFRKNVLERFKSKNLSILIGTSIYDEGVDLPSAEVGINLANGKSVVKTIQRLGRILRKTKTEYLMDVDPNKPSEVMYLDFLDNGNPMTLNSSASRLGVYESEPAYNVRIIDEKEYDEMGDSLWHKVTN